jgi:hypothetical protein
VKLCGPTRTRAASRSGTIFTPDGLNISQFAGASAAVLGRRDVGTADIQWGLLVLCGTGLFKGRIPS